MAGNLNTADLAILGSTLTWTMHESDTGRIAWQSDRYRILSDGDNPRYWTASVRLDRDRVHLGAGAGELGLAKCIKACERHLQASASNSRVPPGCANAPVTESYRPDPQERSREMGKSSNDDHSPAQQQLL